MTKDEALKLALEALKFNQANWRGKDNAITSIKWALAQPAQEPVAYLCKPDKHGLFDRPTPDKACEDCFPVYAAPPQPAQKPAVFWRCNGCSHAYEEVAPSSCDCMDGTKFERVEYFTAPPQRPWVGLTDEEIDTTWKKWIGTERANKSYTLAIEDTLRSKNT